MRRRNPETHEARLLAAKHLLAGKEPRELIGKVQLSKNEIYAAARWLEAFKEAMRESPK
jgi:hypothetical protein